MLLIDVDCMIAGLAAHPREVTIWDSGVEA